MLSKAEYELFSSASGGRLTLKKLSQECVESNRSHGVSDKFDTYFSHDLASGAYSAFLVAAYKANKGYVMSLADSEGSRISDFKSNDFYMCVFRLSRELLNLNWNSNVSAEGSKVVLKFFDLEYLSFSKDMYESLMVLKVEEDFSIYSKNNFNERDGYLRHFSEYLTPLSRFVPSEFVKQIGSYATWQAYDLTGSLWSPLLSQSDLMEILERSKGFLRDNWGQLSLTKSDVSSAAASSDKASEEYQPSYEEVVSHLPSFLQRLERNKNSLTTEEGLTEALKQKDLEMKQKDLMIENLMQQTEDLRVSKQAFKQMFDTLNKSNSELARLSSVSPSGAAGSNAPYEFSVFGGPSEQPSEQPPSNMSVDDDESERASSKRGRSDDA